MKSFILSVCKILPTVNGERGCLRYLDSQRGYLRYIDLKGVFEVYRFRGGRDRLTEGVGLPSSSSVWGCGLRGG